MAKKGSSAKQGAKKGTKGRLPSERVRPAAPKQQAPVNAPAARPQASARPLSAKTGTKRRGRIQGARDENTSFNKIAAVVIMVLIIVSAAATVLLMKPAENKPSNKPPPSLVNDTLASAPVFISEVMPPAKTGTLSQFVELRVDNSITNLLGWKLTTFDNDSYTFPSTPVTGYPAYVRLDITATGGALVLDNQDSLGLYDPQGRLIDFVMWSGGGKDRARGNWSVSLSPIYQAAGQSISRLDFGRYDPLAWNASPPSPGEPNILEYISGNIRQVLWLHSGRDFEASTGVGSSAETLAKGRPVPRQVLLEAASHLEYSIRNLRNLGEPYAAKTTGSGTPLLELWVTNGSQYRGITGAGTKVALDIGTNRNLNSLLCAQDIARLICISKWGAPSDATAYVREGLACQEAMRAAAAETGNSVDGLCTELRTAKLWNPYDSARNMTIPFVTPWTCDNHHMASSWLLFDFADKKFQESGLGMSLSEAMFSSSSMDPLGALLEQTGRNIAQLFLDWALWRASPSFRYGFPDSSWNTVIDKAEVSTNASLLPWSGWFGRINLSVSGDLEINLTSTSSSSGPLLFGVMSVRTGASVLKQSVPAGRSMPFVLPDLRAPDELLVTIASADAGGYAGFRAGHMPQPPTGLIPADGNYTNTATPLLSWSGASGIAAYDIQMSKGSTFLAIEAGSTVTVPSYIPAAALSEGKHYWRVRGVSAMGNPTNWSRVSELYVDTAPPYCHPSLGDPRHRDGPDDLWNITSATLVGFMLNGTPISEESVFFRFSVNESWQSFSGNFTLTGPDGARRLFYRASDIAGNEQDPAHIELRLDNTPPDIKVSTSGPSQAAQTGDVVNVSASTTLEVGTMDAGAGVGEVRFRVDGSGWTAYGGIINFTGLSEGLHLVTVSASDRLGNTDTMTGRFYLDSTPPNLTVINVTQGVIPAGTRVVSANATDRSGVVSVLYLIDGTLKATVETSPYEWTWNTADETDASHSLEVRARDRLDNVRSVFMSVFTDNTAPVTGLAVGEPKFRTGQTDPWNISSKTNITLSPSDAASGVSVTWYRIDGVYHEGTEFFLTGIANGPHNITYGSWDVAGANESAKSITIVLDNAPPLPMITSPMGGNAVFGNVPVNATEMSGAGDVRNATFTYSQDGQNWILISVDNDGSDGWSVVWNTLMVVNGNYQLKVAMRDHLGNEASNTIIVVVNN